MRSSPQNWTTAGLLMLLLLGALRALGNLAAQSTVAIVLLLACSTVYLTLCWRILQPDGLLPGWKALVLFALLFRLTMAGSLPSLSGDLPRYRWEGLARAAGENPYLVQPDDPRLAHLRDDTYPRISSPFRKAGYGPLWLEVQHWTARLARWAAADVWTQLKLCKLPSILGDLVALALLALLLRQHGLPFARWAIYAWCPLPVIEFWSEGHNDSWVAASLLGALLLAGRQRWAGSFAALSVGVLVKFWPLALFPFFAFGPGSSRPRWWQWLVLAPISAPFVWLYWAPVRENADFMTGFLSGWRNNDSLFAVILWLAGPVRAKYLSAVLLLALIAALLLWRVPLARACLLFIAGMLAISSNVHPWYLSWFLPLLALEPWLPLFLWTGLMPLAYRVLAEFEASGRWEGSTPARWLIYIPVYASALWQRRITKEPSR